MDITTWLTSVERLRTDAPPRRNPISMTCEHARIERHNERRDELMIAARQLRHVAPEVVLGAIPELRSLEFEVPSSQHWLLYREHHGL